MWNQRCTNSSLAGKGKGKDRTIPPSLLVATLQNRPQTPIKAVSPEEQEYFRLYTDFLATYKGQYTDIDLTGSLDPPRDLFIDVRVLKDAGEIQTEYGVINLTKNSQFYVRLGDVERLIAQGFLMRLS